MKKNSPVIFQACCLLNFKAKNRISTSSIIETLISLGNPIEAKDIIGKLDDV